MPFCSKPLVPRNGHTLAAGIVARISGGPNQKELSLEDQEDHGKQVVADRYDGPVEYRVLATKGKGERLDRPEIAVLLEILRSDVLDVLVVDDIGRMIRGAEAVRICGIAVDHGTRVLAPNDCIDTGEDNWEEDVISACRDHVGHNAHTSKRIKQKLMNRFLKYGAAPALPVYGYIKPVGAKTYAEWTKDPDAGPVYQEWARILRESLNCTAVADWLNLQGVPTGKYCRSRKIWDGAMVRRLMGNPLLKGMPGRGFKHTIKHYETGRRVTVKNPDGPHFKEYPHLAHFEAAEWEELNALLESKNKGFGRKPVNGVDPRLQVPRKRTRFPGQHARCWYCGRQAVWGGNGIAKNLMCNGSREWKCWNSIGFDGAVAARKLAEAITAELYRLDGIDEQLRDLVEQARKSGGMDLDQVRSQLEAEEGELARQRENLLGAIVECGPRPMLAEKLSELEAKERELARRRRELERRSTRAPELPGSVAELRGLFEAKLRGLAIDSTEYGDVMRRLVPEFHVYLVRLCDGGHLLPRARVRLVLDGIVPGAESAPALGPLLTRELTLDLFEPPQRERVREEAVRLAAQGMEQRDVARQLPESVTQTAVWKALVLDRMMRERGLDSPYEVLMEPPANYCKLRRHKNRKYRFEPVAGFQRPSI